MKKLGWASELQDQASVISVPYDLYGLQVGALFAVPDVYNSRRGRLFRVTEISSIMLAPASVTCRLVPEYEDTVDGSEFNHIINSFSFLNVEEEPNMHNG